MIRLYKKFPKPLYHCHSFTTKSTTDFSSNSEKEHLHYKPDKFILGMVFAFFAYEAFNFYEYSKLPKRNVLNPYEFTLCDITEIKQVTSDTKYYKIRAKNTNVCIPYHVTIKDDSCQVGRSYTPITNDGTEIGLLIKKYPNGVISSLMDKQQVGNQVFIRGPNETMPPYQPNSVQELGMVRN
jgi:hypothetical protein